MHPAYKIIFQCKPCSDALENVKSEHMSTNKANYEAKTYSSNCWAWLNYKVTYEMDCEELSKL